MTHYSVYPFEVTACGVLMPEPSTTNRERVTCPHCLALLKQPPALAADERGADMLPAPACCASFVYDGTHHKDCRFFRP
jgi:hypothetical protein